MRAAQLVEMGRALTIAAWGQALNALLIVYMLGRPAPPVATGACGWSASSLLMLLSRPAQGKLRGREIHSLPRKTLNRAAYHSIFFGLVWASRRATSSSTPTTASSSPCA